MIDDTGQPVIVPWSLRTGTMDAAETILRRVAAMDKPLGPDPAAAAALYRIDSEANSRRLETNSACSVPFHSSLGEALLRFEDLAHYDPKMGVRLGETFRARSSEQLGFEMLILSL